MGVALQRPLGSAIPLLFARRKGRGRYQITALGRVEAERRNVSKTNHYAALDAI